MTTIKLEIVSEDLLACRICLATDTKLYNIYEHRLDELFVNLLDTPLSLCDGFPQHICSFCRVLLLKFSDLKQKCARAEDILRKSLVDQQYITTEHVQSIDRITNKLSLNLKATVNDPNAYQHFQFNDDLFADTKIEVTELGQDTNIDDLDNDNDTNDNDAEMISVLCEPEIYVTDVKGYAPTVIATEIVNIIKEEEPKRKLRKLRSESKKKKLKSKKLKSKNKIKIKNKIEIEKIKEEEIEETAQERKKYPRKKKGFKWYFSCEEDYINFENKYNISVIKLSDEEQKEEMEERKKTDKYRNAQVRCEKCCKGFLSTMTYDNHNKIHDPNQGANECQLCFSRYKFPTHLRQHMMESHSHRYVCKICDQVIRRRSAAMLHSAFHAGRTFECKHCGKNFSKSSTLYTHLRVQHPFENASGGTCDICGETFTGALGLQQHKTRRHRKPLPPGLRCAVCLTQFESLDAVARHTDTAPNNMCDPKLKACPQCGETFLNADQLKSHQDSAHAKPSFKCDECNQSFATKASLSTHIDRVHLNIKPRFKLIYKYNLKRRGKCRLDDFMCETCGKGYASFANLKTHQLKHTGERPFKCNQCPKTFLTAAQAKGHEESIHMGIKKYQCSQCPKTFMDKSSIYKHKVVHTGERPYECEICNKTFTQSGSLSTHVKYVHMKVRPPPRRRRRDMPGMFPINTYNQHNSATSN